MKVAIFLLIVVACAVTAKPGGYTTKYDNIDLDSILNSRRLLDNYVNCLLDAGNCTPDGKELKKILPDALKNECKDCSQNQRLGSEKVIRFLVNKRPDAWDKLATKYDPENEYKKKFQTEAEKAGIKL
ncbi:ejaculatory bulb-specific protein 3-like [Diprion similis]|uniref:ejaculatory bulb-specific protein 3-like n=1 Tax=Diprion similis TaxID=362088 RepID=UPI001EF7E6D2|nr:ejaculatory bulb-specific protein 3-like [Diprion similis]